MEGRGRKGESDQFWKQMDPTPELDVGPFFLTQSNPVHQPMDPIQFNSIWILTTYIKSSQIHKYQELNRTRKLCDTNYSNADF